MSSYFDTASAKIRDTWDDLNGQPVNEILNTIRKIESGVISEIIIIAGDREFPDDLRKEICECIANNAIIPESLSACGFMTRGQGLSECLKQSQLVEKLHDIFHKVAQRRIETRFGRLSDHPIAMLRNRAEYQMAHNWD